MSLKDFSVLRPIKNNVRFEYVHENARFKYVPWKMSDFVSFPLFGFTLVIKLINFDFEGD